MKKLDKLFNPKSIAIVGASPKKEKLGNVLMNNIIAGGWRGRIYCVNPKHKKIGSYKCFAKISDIKKPIDAALIAVPAPYVNEIIADGSKSKPEINNYVIISAGFKEAGNVGKKLEEDLVSIAQKHNLNILGPNCLGFLNSDISLNATFAEEETKKGRVAIVSQSGALAVELLDWMQSARVGFSKVVSLGNKAILDESDLIQYLGKDKKTSFVALYLEDIKNGEKFFSAAAKVAASMPLIVLKAGKTAAGQKAVSSHTGALAQDEDIIKNVLEKLNIIEASNIQEFQDIIEYLNYAEIPGKSEVIVLTNAGGPGVMASDFIGSSAVLKMARIPTQIQKKLKKILPHAAAVQNPIDILGDADPKRYENVLKILARDRGDYPVVVILTPQSQAKPAEVAMSLAKYKKAIPALAACFMGGEKIQVAEKDFRKIGIANFESPERALLVIEKLAKHKNREKIRIKTDWLKKNHKPDVAVQNALAEKRGMLFWQETEKIFKKYGIELTKSISLRDLDSLGRKKISFPCVLKSDEPGLAHRWDKKAVQLNIKNIGELEAAKKKISKTAKAHNFIIQPMLPPGLEMIIGTKRDPAFGPILMAGWGGTYAEIVKDNMLFVPPVEKREIAAKLKQLKVHPILGGFRGEKKYDIEEITNMLMALQNIAVENPDIAEIDINPLILYNDGKKCQIVDAKIFLKSP